MLAPMVRIGLLPMRLTSLEFGADLVYTDETIDLKIIGTERFENAELGTVDYLREGRVMFRTHPSEKDRLIFQIGSSDPDLALKAALTVARDIGGIDLNCGCPKHFSVHKGMGAALLSTPDLLCDILENLVKHSGVPVTCKIRIFNDLQKTIELVQRIEKTGVKAIGVHCRTRYMKPGDPGKWDYFEHLVKAVNIPIIANGDVFTQDDIQRILKTGVSSVMLARGAQHNPSVFRNEGILPAREAAKIYMKYAIKYDNPYQNSKYTVASMRLKLKKEAADALHRAKSLAQMCKALGFDDLLEDALRLESREIYDDMCPYIPDNDGLVAVDGELENKETAEVDEEDETALR